MKILIVDDDKENVYLLETLLKGNGYDTVSVGNGAEALEQLRSRPFDLIISDILMPVMDGFQLCRQVKQDIKLKRIPFVFYTATYTDAKDEELALKTGADIFIRKPMEPEEFLQQIRAVLKNLKEGQLEVKNPPEVEEKEILKLYDERLVNKLESKISQLEKANADLIKAEEALAKAKKELEIRVKERTQELADSEEKYRLVVENASEVITIVQDGVIKFFGGKAVELTGYRSEEVISKSFLDVVFSEDRARAAETYRKYIMGGAVSPSHEFRVVRKNGEIRWVQMTAAIITWEKKPAILAIFSDINERKTMEQTLKDYAQKITRVQEAERKRIAYELHDDTAQYLSILKLELDAILESGKVQDPAVQEKLQFLEKDANRAFDDVCRYSHELRPGVLEHLGLQVALEQIVEDLNKLQQIPIALHIKGNEPEVPEDIKLAFFRIAQEALNNARRHSKASEVTIDLNFNLHAVQMIVSDDGVGFNTSQVVTNGGRQGNLGLMSMQERAKMIGANLKIESEAGKGTRVILKSKL